MAGWDASPLQSNPRSIKIPGTNFYLGEKTLKVRCVSQENNTMSLAGLEPVPVDLEASARTMRPLRYPFDLGGDLIKCSSLNCQK